MTKAPKPTAGIHKLCLQDQAPAIGSGWRSVQVRKLGYKWVHLRCAHTRKPARIKREVFDDVWQRTHDCLERNRNPDYAKSVRR